MTTPLSNATATITRDVTAGVSKATTIGAAGASKAFGGDSSFTFGTGTAGNEINLVYENSGTLTTAGGASTSFILQGTLKDIFQHTVSFATVKGVALRNNSLTKTLHHGGANSNFRGWFGTTGITIREKTAPAVLSVNESGSAGWPVGATGALNIEVQNGLTGGEQVAYDIVIIGTSI